MLELFDYKTMINVFVEAKRLVKKSRACLLLGYHVFIFDDKINFRAGMKKFQNIFLVFVEMYYHVNLFILSIKIKKEKS